MNLNKTLSVIALTAILSACTMMGEKKTVYFNSGSTQIDHQGRLAIMEAAKIAKKDNKSVKLIGMTDSKGSKDNNMKLAEKRVTEVNKMLTQLGVPSKNIETKTRGEALLDHKEMSDREERRVDIRIY